MTTVDLGELGRQAEARKRPKRTNPPAPSRRRGVPQSQVGSGRLRRPDPTSPEPPSGTPTAAPERIPAQQHRVVAPPKAKEPPRRPTASTPLIRATLHLNADEDRYLERIAFAGKSASPKVDISRSAVVRLAIAKLEQTMTDDEIVTALGVTIEVGQAGGRPRR